MNNPDPEIETQFVPDLHRPIDPLPTSATLADVVDRVNLLTSYMNQILLDIVGIDEVEER